MKVILGIGISVNGSQEAVKLYQKVFGFRLGYHMLNKDGSFFHSELLEGDDPVCSVVEASGPISKTGNPIELGYFFQTREEVDRAAALLGEGGEITLGPQELPWSPWAACVTDRFGVRWFLSMANHLPPEDFQPGDELH